MSDLDNDLQAKTNTAEQLEADAEHPQVEAALLADNDGDKPAKRGRGRPKGSKNKPREGATTAALTSEGPKRKRGRPPKEKPTNVGGNNQEDVTGDDHPAKRSRGRPRKNPASTNAGAPAAGAPEGVAAAAAVESSKDDLVVADTEGGGANAATAPASTGSGTAKKRGRPPKSTS